MSVFNRSAYENERHRNQLPTRELHTTYAEKMAHALEDAAKVLERMAAAMRASPERLLEHAFSPDITSLNPLADVVIEVTRFQPRPSGLQMFAVRGTTILDGQLPREIGFRAVADDQNYIVATRDNRFAV